MNDSSVSRVPRGHRASVSLVTVMTGAVLVFGVLSLSIAGSSRTSSSGPQWVGTWSTAPQLVEPANNPPTPGLTNNTLRQIVRISLGGDSLRLRLSNEFSTSPVTLHAVQIALSKGGSAIDTTTETLLAFGGTAEVVIAPGTAIMSDPIYRPVQPRTDLAITIYFGATSADVTGHPGSRTTSYILTGNQISNAAFSGAVTTDHWYVINTIDVLADSTTSCVAILGNSITDGRGSTTNLQNRWPDVFSEALLKDSSTQHVAVLNMGIGGNCVLAGGLGPTGVSRFDRDILGQRGVRWAIVFEGVNDIGGVRSSGAATSTANNLIGAYQQMITKAHNRNITIYGATITPFKGNGYYNQYSELCRATVNQWIRTKGNFDGCIDFDAIMRDPLDSLRLVSTYQNDGLHPDAAGYLKMGQSIDRSMFIEPMTTGINERYESLPRTIQLGQNYPNPFNPSTTISFSLPSRLYASLKIYEVRGREVATLVSGELPAGNYSEKWNGGELSSGIYFYRLQAGTTVETRKMLYLK